MLSMFKKLFVGVSAFAVALLYFYALSLSISIVWNDLVPWYIVLAAWGIVSAVLYEEKEYGEIAQAIQSLLDRPN
jgi:hypothetical protein